MASIFDKLFGTGIKNLEVGQEVNTITSEGVVTKLTATVQSAPIKAEIDPTMTASIAQINADLQAKLAEAQAKIAASTK